MKYELAALPPLAHDPSFIPTDTMVEPGARSRTRVKRPQGEAATFIDSALGVQIGLYADQEAEEAALAEAERFLEEVGDAQLTLTVNLESLERSLDPVAYDPSTVAAAATLKKRLTELRDMADALSDVHVASASPELAPLFGRDAPLADYLRGIHAWSNGVVRAYEQLALELRAPPVNWARLRGRLDEAPTFHMRQLTGRIHAELADMRALRRRARPLLDDLEPKLAHLFVTADRFMLTIRLRFG